MKDKKPNTVEEYIELYPEDIQALLSEIRALIRDVAHDATEQISYGMPAYKYNGKPLIYFGAHKDHIGVYATPDGHSAFEKKLSAYKRGKGSVQFPIQKPFPFELIRKMVLYRIESLKK